MEPDREPADEPLFDAYLDAALAGDAETPEAFLARHPDASDALRARIEALHRAAAPAARTASAQAGDGGLLPSQRIGAFRLLAPLGEGGMGTLFRAVQEPLGRIVALKVIREDLRGSASARARFEREASSAARLRHPHVAQVHAVGDDAGVAWIAMELVEGRSLDELIDDAARAGTRLSLRDVLRWGAEVADALAAVHAAGLVHRDVKPSNIRIDASGRAVLVDFGVVREIGSDGPTLTGGFVGSPIYAAPEQIAGDVAAVDGRADVFSLGATLFHAICGRAAAGSGTATQVMHAVANVDAPPIRSVVRDVPRDVDVVVGKALERDASRRYATAAELAADLRAILDLRPIRARRVGPAGRAARWARRNPVAAAAVTVAVVSVAGAIAWTLGAARARRAQTRTDATAAVNEARDAVGRYERSIAAAAELDHEIGALRSVENTRWTTAEEDRALDERSERLDALRRERDEAFTRILEALNRAERLDPEVAGLADTRARLYLVRLRDSRNRNDAAAVRWYAKLVEENDVGGALAAEVRGVGTLRIDVDPPDADVELFRLVQAADLTPGGERRLVPVACAGESPAPPGTLALRVTEAAGDVRRGDVVLAIDGAAVGSPGVDVRAQTLRAGARALVQRRGKPFETTLAPGIVVVPTAAPLLATTECLRNAARDGPVPIEGGAWIVRVRRAGFCDSVLHIDNDAGSARHLRVALSAESDRPRGFVEELLLGTGGHSRDPMDPFWIQEREVTVAEWREFLRDPEIAARAELRRSLVPRDIPRGTSLWTRGADGWAPPEGTDSFPVLGVSFDDAAAYCAWRTARAAAAGEPWAFSLPREDQWRAAACSRGARWTYGPSFRPKWAKTCFSRPRPCVEPVMSYPTDETSGGAFDLSGSAMEWCDAWLDDGRTQRLLAGGSWAQGDPEACSVYAGIGASPDFASSETGFRMVAHRRGAGR